MTRRRPPAGQPDNRAAVNAYLADPIIPTPGSHQPGVANIRIIGSAAVVDAAAASLADFYGGFWQPGTRKPSRTSSDVLLYGTLIVPVPTLEQT